jgi:NADH-quinone oxidoreductase subunit N
MSLMASANHLMMVFIGVEMASLPSYALAGFLKGRRQSSEAALKYVVYGGAASGVMLYGISLLSGRFGTGGLPEVAEGFRVLLPTADPILLTGTMMLLIGFAFKIAAVPFHFWCPDVFEGAAAEVAGFLSVSSKAAALALLGRFSLALFGATSGAETVPPEQWESVALYLVPTLAVFAALTTTFGNLAAYAQTNLKRLLAYSTIAHAGYMLMAVATLTRAGIDAMLVYLVAYLFMNLGAFAVVAFIRNRTGSEDLSTYGGMIYRAPLLTVTLAIFMLSLLGMPPLIGFPVKFQIFAVLWNSAQTAGPLRGVLLALLLIGLLNTVLSLVYYVKVLKVMILEDPPPGTELRPLSVPVGQQVYAGLLAAVVSVGILFWNYAADAGRHGVEKFPPVRTAAGLEQAATDKPR